MEPITGSVCRACRVRIAYSTGKRAFSTSISRRAVPPESPLYVDVPSSFQPLSPYYPTPKGILPVPREIFPANRPEKATKTYIRNVTKEPKPENVVPDSMLTETGRYKARMSEMRRTQLREALTALIARKKAETKEMASRSKSKQKQRSALLKQGEREDARLTNVSTPKEMHPTSQSSIEALRAELEVTQRQYETKLANVAAHTEDREAMKMDALHTLYMNARRFVTTEKQFDELVKEQFDIPEDGSRSHAKFMTDNHLKGNSMWNFGPPQGISDRVTGRLNEKGGTSAYLNQISGTKYSASRYTRIEQRKKARNLTRSQRDQSRFKKIAEKLSGGKI